MVWAAPVIGAVLPDFRAGVPALRWLAVGALMLSAATLPGYFVLATGSRPALLLMSAGTALFTALLVFGVAARDHRPASIAMAASAGYAAFALGLVALAAPGLEPTAGARLRFAVRSFVPPLWGAGLALAGCAWLERRAGSPAPAAGPALLLSIAVLAGYLPVLWWLGRGIGLGQLARGWLSGRPAAT
jgi:hypothetical protein